MTGGNFTHSSLARLKSPGWNNNTWGEVLNTSLSDIVARDQLETAIADALTPTAPTVEQNTADLLLSGAMLGAAAVMEAEKPVSRKALFGWLRK